MLNNYFVIICFFIFCENVDMSYIVQTRRKIKLNLKMITISKKKHSNVKTCKAFQQVNLMYKEAQHIMVEL